MKKLIIAFALLGISVSVGLVGQARAQEKELVFHGLQLEEFEYRRGDEG